MIILLIAYGLFLLGLIAFGGSAVYHALQFGLPGDSTRAAAFVYIATVLIVVVVSFIVIGTVDYTESPV